MFALLMLLFGVAGGWPAATQSSRSDFERSCSSNLDPGACQCDMSCAQYGDCCLDAPWFVSEQQRLGASAFSCESFDNTNVYMMSSCPPEWKDPHTRFHCEHPDTSYRDPLSEVPITSHRTNITYRNRHCAFCHRDLDADSSELWPIYFSCENALINLDNDIINYLVYNTTASSWTLDITENPELLIFRDVRSSRHVYSCRVWVEANEALRALLRTCDSSAVVTCPEDWTDKGVRVQCEAYTAHMCLSGVVYRNHYCGVCNNNGSFNGSDCVELGPRLRTTVSPDFTVLLDWHRLNERDVCQRETETYDPFTRTCRSVFEYAAPEDYTRASENETSVSSLDTCFKIQLEPAEYYVQDNVTMAVFIPAHNRTLQLQEYRIGNDSRLTMCLPEFGADDEEEYSQGLGYITLVGLSLSIGFLILHLFAFGLTPRLHNLSSMNLACLSVTLLLVYCSFFGSVSLKQTGIPCVSIAVIIHYSLLASFFWMLTIAYDINRVLRVATTKLLVSTGRHWHRFGVYCLWSWIVPAVIVGVALAAEFSSDGVLEYVRPGYGVSECWFDSGRALLTFIVGPLSVVMILNAVLFFWSACIIYTSTSELKNTSCTHRDFRLYCRLALIMGLTWIIGLVAAFVDNIVVWYAFVILNTLQGLFIFLAFTCTQKVWQELRPYRQTQAYAPSPATMYT